MSPGSPGPGTRSLHGTHGRAGLADEGTQVVAEMRAAAAGVRALLFCDSGRRALDTRRETSKRSCTAEILRCHLGAGWRPGTRSGGQLACQSGHRQAPRAGWFQHPFRRLRVRDPGGGQGGFLPRPLRVAWRRGLLPVSSQGPSPGPVSQPLTRTPVTLTLGQGPP